MPVPYHYDGIEIPDLVSSSEEIPALLSESGSDSVSDEADQFRLRKNTSVVAVFAVLTKSQL